MTAMAGDGSAVADPPDPKIHVVPFAVIDLGSVGRFTVWLAGVLDGCGTDVVLDFGQVEMVLALGVQVLLDAERVLVPSGRRLRIRHAAPIVRRVLEICEVADRWLV